MVSETPDKVRPLLPLRLDRPVQNEPMARASPIERTSRAVVRPAGARRRGVHRNQNAKAAPCPLRPGREKGWATPGTAQTAHRDAQTKRGYCAVRALRRSGEGRESDMESLAREIGMDPVEELAN
jgi:hypothetical protein